MFANLDDFLKWGTPIGVTILIFIAGIGTRVVAYYGKRILNRLDNIEADAQYHDVRLTRIETKMDLPPLPPRQRLP